MELKATRNLLYRSCKHVQLHEMQKSFYVPYNAIFKIKKIVSTSLVCYPIKGEVNLLMFSFINEQQLLHKKQLLFI